MFKSKSRNAFLLLALWIVLIIAPLSSLAASGYYEGSLVPCGIKGDLCTLCHFVLLAKNIFQFLLKISLAFAILIGAIAGVLYITSAGTEALMNTAKEAIKLALLGFLFCLLAWLFVNITAKLMGYTENWWSLNMECKSYKKTTTPTPAPATNEETPCQEKMGIIASLKQTTMELAIVGNV
jgi:hypothetical protein